MQLEQFTGATAAFAAKFPNYVGIAQVAALDLDGRRLMAHVPAHACTGHWVYATRSLKPCLRPAPGFKMLCANPPHSLAAPNASVSRALLITLTELMAIAAPATTGVRTQDAANGMPATL